MERDDDMFGTAHDNHVVMHECMSIAKGPFADRYVPLYLREIISSEAGANDGFGFPFLMLATFIIRYEWFTASFESGEGGHIGQAMTGEPTGGHHARLMKRDEVTRQGGGLGMALGQWGLECVVYIVLMSVVYGALLGWMARKGLHYALRKRWVDSESYLLFPTALGLFTLGTCGLVGTDDLLACFVAGCALNWDNEYLEESERRNEEVNSCMDVLLNFGGFMYIGAVVPWTEMHLPEETGLTIGRLMGLGVLVLLLRRIPGVFMLYKAMPAVCKNWRDALFMGYFGPIGIGAVFYVEHAKHLFPHKGSHDLEGDPEVRQLVDVMAPVVYFMVVFSIVVHGLSIPALNAFYHWRGVPAISNDSRSFDDISLKESYFSGGSRRNRFSRIDRPGSAKPYGIFSDPFSKRSSQDFSSSKAGLVGPPPAAYKPTRPDSMLTGGPDPGQPQQGITFAPQVRFKNANPEGKPGGHGNENGNGGRVSGESISGGMSGGGRFRSGSGGSGYESGEDGKARRKSGLSFISSGGGNRTRRASNFGVRSVSRNSSYHQMPDDYGDTGKMV
ncbi:MAG: hypothetical protein M1831_005326 [Alyxoria varia]|nr:MAG: hypothetical protein M1831_005326 [Alyxoria varia]